MSSNVSLCYTKQQLSAMAVTGHTFAFTPSLTSFFSCPRLRLSWVVRGPVSAALLRGCCWCMGPVSILNARLFTFIELPDCGVSCRPPNPFGWFTPFVAVFPIYWEGRCNRGKEAYTTGRVQMESSRDVPGSFSYLYSR